MDKRKKVAVVTGGTGHVGVELVTAMLQDGWHVVVPGRDRSSLEKLYSKLNPDMLESCIGIEADLTEEPDVKRLVDLGCELKGGIDAIVNLIGMFSFGRKVHEMPVEEWRTVIEVNLTSVFLCCKHVLPVMLETGCGCIVNTTSKAAVDIQPGASAYAVAKTGIITLTEALREEVKDTDIRVNAIMPGIIDTEVTRKLMPSGNPDKWVKPAGITETIMCLCNGHFRDVSGSVLRMFGRM